MKTINNYITEKLKINMTSYTCQPKTKAELRDIIRKRLATDNNANLNDIDVSQITNMAELFFRLDPHNIDISDWDVSNVESMRGMFYGCENFNSDLSGWDVSNVTTMLYMFNGCANFNSDLSEWDVSKSTNISYMFNKCTALKNKPDWYSVRNENY